MNKTPTRYCIQCRSILITVSEVTETVEGSRFPQTTTIYRCSNISCQEERDKQTELRLKQQKEKEAAAKKRAEEKHAKK